MPAIRPDVLTAIRPTAPRWKRVPGRSDYLLWDGSRYTIGARWNGSSWTLTELRPQPTPNQAFVCGNRPVVGFQFHPEFTLELVKLFSNEYSQEWVPGPYVSGKAAVLAETKEMPDTYSLMETLLDNMDSEFG